MILGFKERFVDKIIWRSKIHTIRIDAHDRWKPDMKIHFATGVRTKKYRQFKSGECKSTQLIEIKHRGGKYMMLDFDNETGVWIDGELKFTITGIIHNGTGFMNTLAKNDGFKDYNEFFKWFNKDFKGKIIHWTNYRY
ncbi:MAG: hypothetical protein LC136_10430 [Burkholderiales bacterium]|nr:hypothetical protein [Burkholderiales bacterium]